MGFLEQLGQFHAQAGQLVDVEETPVIDFFRSNAPIGDPVGLHFEQLVQARETQRVTRLTPNCFNAISIALEKDGSVARSASQSFSSAARSRALVAGHWSIAENSWPMAVSGG